MDRDAWNDNEEDGSDETDEVDEASDDEDDGTTIPCPHCRCLIHEDSYRCPRCGTYLSEEETAPSRKPWWIIVGVLLVLYVVYRWTVG